MFFLDHIWLIPLFPAFGAAIMFFFGRKLRKATVSAVCVGAVALAFVLPACAVWQYTGYAHDNPGKPFEKIVYTWLGTDTGHMNYVKRDGTPAAVPRRCRLPARSALRHLAAVRHRRRHAHPYLFHRLHGARRRLLPLLRIPQSVHVLHADADPGEQLRR